MLTKLGRFSLLSRISKGAMGETYVAEHVDEKTGEKRRVCVKVLSGEDADDPKWIQGFQHEARLVSHLRHPNLVGLYELGHTMGWWWMALELVEGIDVRALLSERRASRQRLPVDVVVRIAAELAKGLSYAHNVKLSDGATGIIHRDVSPSNILLGFDGRVLLADFGIAKAKHDQRTRTGKIRGKVLYMSPEQALGDPLDGRSDLFALGVVMFELLAGERPFDGQTINETRLNAVNGIKKDLQALAPDVSGGLVEIVNVMLEKEPANRFGNAALVHRLLSDQPMREDVVQVLGGIVKESRANGAVVRPELTDMDMIPMPRAR